MRPAMIRSLRRRWALGLLEGERPAGRARQIREPISAFAWRKQWWDNWFRAVDRRHGRSAEPGDHVWQGIAARVGAQAGVQGGAADSFRGGEVIELQTRLRRWQWGNRAHLGGGGRGARGAGLRSGKRPRMPGDDIPLQVAAADPMVATVPIGETGLRLDVTWIPESERMLVRRDRADCRRRA